MGRGDDDLPRRARGNRSPDRPLRCGPSCGDKPMTKFPVRVAAAALFLTVPLTACGGGAEGEDKHEEGESHGEGEEESEGPNGGRLLKSGDFAVEVTIFENGTEPQIRDFPPPGGKPVDPKRSDEHTSELQSLMRTSYGVFCWH